MSNKLQTKVIEYPVGRIIEGQIEDKYKRPLIVRRSIVGKILQVMTNRKMTRNQIVKRVRGHCMSTIERHLDLLFRQGWITRIEYYKGIGRNKRLHRIEYQKVKHFCADTVFVVGD